MEDRQWNVEPEVGPREGVPGVSSPLWREVMEIVLLRFGETGREPDGLEIGKGEGAPPAGAMVKR